ncbi:MAG TPA: gephyrin-like molybdotransferase Glp [Gaiellaceae bacterium]|nr:gephyrin-like molybdotransferase Glp [Gaiellaceae bacterium]
MNQPVRVDQALGLVLAEVNPLPAETVALADARGRVLCEAVEAAVDLPPFDSSAMDGFAVRAADTPGRLVLAGASAAGGPFAGVVEPGSAVAISTGAVVPPGADAIVPIERAVAADETVDVEAVSPGEHVRPRGGDVRSGEVVAAAGTRLGAWAVGAAAAVGAGQVRVARRPRVAVLATGSELREPGVALRDGEIYEANTQLLGALLEQTGAQVDVLGSVADDEQSTRAALERGLAADVLVTSGGVSVGRHDLVRAALASLGGDEVFWRVAVKPGKPISFGVRGSTLVFGLPGNPVSALVGFELFVRPAVLALQGSTDPGPHWQPGRLGTAVRRDRERDQLVRARVVDGEHGPVLEPVSGQESHMIVRAAGADALVFVERGDGEQPAGSAARYLAPT